MSKYRDVVAFRLGYTGRHDLSSGITYGLRLGNERLHLDYSFVPFGALGDTHRLTLGVRFGRTYKQQQVQTQITQAYERAEARYAQGYVVEAYIQAGQIIDVAPWHRPSRNLMHKIEGDFKQLEDVARKDQFHGPGRIVGRFGRKADGEQFDNRIGRAALEFVRAHGQHAVEMQAGAHAQISALAAFPFEAVEQSCEAALLRQIDQVAHARDGILQACGYDLQILVVLGGQNRFACAHSGNRSISAPTRPSFSSSRSKPRSK